MPHPLVVQLRFARSEFMRGLVGVTDEEARRRFMPMNCIAWNIGHLAWQEQRYWLGFGQKTTLLPQVQQSFTTGAPASTPALDEVMASWRAIIAASDPWLDELKRRDAAGKRCLYRIGATQYHLWQLAAASDRSLLVS